MKSILQSNKECLICGTERNLHEHHIFFGNPNRKNSEKYGLKVWLCMNHHTGGNNSPHRNREIDLSLKTLAQEAFEEKIGTREEFIEIFGKSWL